MKNFLTHIKEAVAAQFQNGTYVYRRVLNAQRFYDWGQAQNLGGVPMAAEKMHCTIMYSTVNIRGHRAFNLNQNIIEVDPTAFAGRLQFLGQEGAIVLKFQSVELHERWVQFLGMGALWTFPTFVPHITLAYNKEVQTGWWQQVIPSPNFHLVLGPEQVDDVKDMANVIDRT